MTNPQPSPAVQSDLELPTEPGYYFCGYKKYHCDPYLQYWDGKRLFDLETNGEPGAEVLLDRFSSFVGPLVPASQLESENRQLPEREKALIDLVGHCWVHSGYQDCGYQQMDSEMRKLYDEVKAIED